MKKFSDKEYKIYENIAQAKSILRKNGGSIEDDNFLQIADLTNKDSWTGLLTRFVYVDKIDVGEVIEIYPDLRKAKLDLGKLSKMSYDDIVDSIYADSKIDNEGIEFIARAKNYLIFHVKTFEDGLKICSPAWCLKTRHHWVDYTNNGYQFVVINESYVNKRGNTKLLTPDSAGYFGEYINKQKPNVRFGVSVKSDERYTVFDDSNKIRTEYQLPPGVLHEIKNFIGNKGDYAFIVKRKDDEYGWIVDRIIHYMDNRCSFTDSWDRSVEGRNTPDYDSIFEDFLAFAAEENIDMYDFYEKYRALIIEDDNLIKNGGSVDYILYKLSGNKGHDAGGVPLSGMWLVERDIEDGSYKYIYGFVLNKYGRMYILQSYDNIAHWYKSMLIDFGSIFLNGESLCGGSAEDNMPVFRWLQNHIDVSGSSNIYPLVDIFFNRNVKVEETYCSRVFYIYEFVETMTNWIKLKYKLSLNPDDSDTTFADEVFADNLINTELIISAMIEMSEYTSKNRIVDFVNLLAPDTIFEEYPVKETISELNVETTLDFFNYSLSNGMKYYSDNKTTTVELIKNNISGEKSDECMIIKFFYKPIK